MERSKVFYFRKFFTARECLFRESYSAIRFHPEIHWVPNVFQGMIYLHESVIKYHGALSTSNCLVDSRWVVKLADFGLHEFKKDAECEPCDVMKKYHGI